MGQSFVFHWFGKSVTDLKAILEMENLTDEQRKAIEAEIEKHECEC